MAQDSSQQQSNTARPKRQLTLFDSMCIILGIILGAGIYQSSPLIASCVPNVWWLMGIWFLGGLISLFGALCYAELATAYPKEGGDYVYLTRAYGRSTGFLFAWSQLWVICPGSTGAMAYVFATYAYKLRPFLGEGQAYTAQMLYACGAIIVLTLINILGVNQGKWTQNILTTVKVMGLAVIIATGLLFSAADTPVESSPADSQVTAAESASSEDVEQEAATDTEAIEAETDGVDWRAIGLAMILVLFTYGGWNDMAYVGAEVRNPKKNIFRALILGTVGVTVIYLLITLAFVTALGFEGLQGSGAVADDVMRLAIGDWGGKVISLLICISALGAINGLIFTASRIYYAMGTEHRMFAMLGRWSPVRGTPVASLAIQAVITLMPVVAFAVLRNLGKAEGGFQSMIHFTAPLFWSFLLLVGAALFVLRFREPDTARPFRVPGYPVTPILFISACCYMVYSSVTWGIEHSTWESGWGAVILVLGVCLALIDAKQEPLSGNVDVPEEE